MFSIMFSCVTITQAEAMCKHYRTAVLLIEFDGDKSFGLQPVSELGDDIDGRAIGSKLTLLCLHFPRLRLVWSRRCDTHTLLHIYSLLSLHPHSSLDCLFATQPVLSLVALSLLWARNMCTSCLL